MQCSNILAVCRTSNSPFGAYDVAAGPPCSDAWLRKWLGKGTHALWLALHASRSPETGTVTLPLCAVAQANGIRVDAAQWALRRLAEVHLVQIGSWWNRPKNGPRDYGRSRELSPLGCPAQRGLPPRIPSAAAEAIALIEKSSTRGGARPGAGRPKGSKNKSSGAAEITAATSR